MRQSFAIIGGFVLFGALAPAADLPPLLQRDLDDLNAKLGRIERQIGSFSPKQVEQSLAEAHEWIEEFTLDAELFDDDPIVLELKNRLATLERKAAAAAKEAMKRAEQNESQAPKSASRALEELLEIEVDLQNVSFKRDVAPLIAESCLQCHNANRSSGDFDASTFQSFSQYIEPGNPEESHILNLVTGRAQPRMPRGGGGFAKQAVDIWTAWIQAGAQFDGSDAEAPITSYLVDADAKRREKIRSLSPEEMEQLHHIAIQRQIDLVQPQRPVHAYATPNFLVRTTLEEPDAEYIAVLAEAIIENLRPRYQRETDKQSMLGRTAIIVFRDRYDYVAFARQVDNYVPEDHEFGHIRLRPELRYIAMTTDVADASLDQLVAQQVASAFFRLLPDEKMPDWAIYANARVESQSWDPAAAPQVRDELFTAAQLLAGGRSLQDILDTKLPWVETAPLATSFVAFLAATDRSKADAFNQLLALGQPLARASEQALKTSLQQLHENWKTWAIKRFSKRR